MSIKTEPHAVEPFTTRMVSEPSGSVERVWTVFGQSIPKAEIVFFAQIFVLYTVIAFSIYNLSTERGDSNLWTALLSSSLGYMLPNPTLKHKATTLG